MASVTPKRSHTSTSCLTCERWHTSTRCLTCERSHTSTRCLTSGVSRYVGTRCRSNGPPGCRPKTRAAAPSLYAVGTRLFTFGVGGPSYDLSPLRDLIAWRDERNRV
jgi:hypothetical protein